MFQSLLRHGPERVFIFFIFFYFLAKLLIRRPPDLPDLLRRHCKGFSDNFYTEVHPWSSSGLHFRFVFLGIYYLSLLVFFFSS